MLTALRALLRSKAADSNRPLRSRSSSSSGSSNRPVTSIFSKPACHGNRTCISAKQHDGYTTLSWGHVDAKLCQLHASMMPFLPQLLISVFSSFKPFLWKGEEGRFQAGDHRVPGTLCTYAAIGQSGMCRHTFKNMSVVQPSCLCIAGYGRMAIKWTGAFQVRLSCACER